MWGELIAAGSNLIGGLMGEKAAKKERGIMLNAQNESVQNRVKDSLKAGVHPLFGLGMQGMNYPGVQVGQAGEGIARAGQDIGRAVDAVRTTDQRLDAFTQKMQNLQLQRGSLENSLLASQLAREAQQRVPSKPDAAGDRALIDGQGDTRSPIRAFGMTIKPRKNETPASKAENEYGEWADAMGAARLARDASPEVDKAFWAWLTNQWNLTQKNAPNDLFYVKPKRGKPARAPNRADVWKRR